MKTYELASDLKTDMLTYEGARQGHIRTLVRRRDHLRQKIEDNPGWHDMDRFEYQALCEAVWVLENLYTYEWIYKELEDQARERFEDVQKRAIQDSGWDPEYYCNWGSDQQDMGN